MRPAVEAGLTHPAKAAETYRRHLLASRVIDFLNKIVILSVAKRSRRTCGFLQLATSVQLEIMLGTSDSSRVLYTYPGG